MASTKTKKISSPLMSREEVAEYLQIPLNTLDIWRHRGNPAIPFLKIGSTVKYHREELEKWLLKQRRTETEKS